MDDTHRSAIVARMYRTCASALPASSATSSSESMALPRKKSKTFERLQALEEVKELLTKEEYTKKRLEVIDAI